MEALAHSSPVSLAVSAASSTPYRRMKKCRRRDLNPHSFRGNRILNPARLPFRHFGQVEGASIDRPPLLCQFASFPLEYPGFLSPTPPPPPRHPLPNRVPRCAPSCLCCALSGAASAVVSPALLSRPCCHACGCENLSQSWRRHVRSERFQHPIRALMPGVRKTVSQERNR
jgi:hypothetical protein